jgi:GxxExxY protein
MPLAPLIQWRIKPCMPLLFEEQTRVLRRCLFDVHNEVGVGYPEEAYHRGFLACCTKRGIAAVSKQAGSLRHRDRLVHTFQYDVLAMGEVLLELKALPGGFTQENYFQIISYLKFWRKSLGLLVNFGQERVKVDRVPYAPKPVLIQEDYEHIRPLLTKSNRAVLRQIRAGILTVGKMHGLGYGVSVCNKLLAAEWQHLGLAMRTELSSTVKFEEDDLGRFPLDAMLLDEQIVCCVSALKEDLGPFELARTQTTLRALGLPIGLAVNFGKHALQIRGVHAPK